MSLLLDNNILARFTQPNVVTGLVLLVIGLVLAIFAKRITKLIRKRNDVKSNDKVYLTLKAVALAIILASLIVMIVE